MSGTHACMRACEGCVFGIELRLYFVFCAASPTLAFLQTVVCAASEATTLGQRAQQRLQRR